MEYRFLAAQELIIFINIYCVLLIISLGGLFVTLIKKNVEKYFITSLLCCAVVFIAVIAMSTVNVYAETFSQESRLPIRFGVYLTYIVLVTIVGISFLKLRRK